MILVVDDHGDTRNALLRLLKMDGYEVMGVANGGEALAFMEGNVPQLVVLDWGLPDVEGLEVFEKMRGEERLAKVPVILFSAYEGVRKERAVSAGVDSYIVKGSLDWVHLKKEIQRLAGPGTLPARWPDAGRKGNERMG